MAVRFLRVPDEQQLEPEPDRSNLAEVIEFRSLLQDRFQKLPAESAGSDSESESDSDSEYESASASEIERESESESDVMSAVDLAADANADAIRLLARRAKSSGELHAELLRLGHAVDQVETVIDDFEQSLYLDDAGLARSLTEKLRTTKRASRSQIRMRLKARKLADGVIEVALGELDEHEELALLRSTATDRARRMRGLDRVTAERRLLGFLARRGWSGEPAARATREALNGSEETNGGVRFR